MSPQICRSLPKLISQPNSPSPVALEPYLYGTTKSGAEVWFSSAGLLNYSIGKVLKTVSMILSQVAKYPSVALQHANSITYLIGRQQNIICIPEKYHFNCHT